MEDFIDDVAEEEGKDGGVVLLVTTTSRSDDDDVVDLSCVLDLIICCGRLLPLDIEKQLTDGIQEKKKQQQ